MSDLYRALYSPEKWAKFASGEFYNFYRDIARDTGSSLPPAARDPPELKRESSQNWPTYTSQAITCGDSIDWQNYITTRTVFDELIRVVRDVSPMCMWTCCNRFLLLTGHLQSEYNSLSLVITAIDGPLMLSNNSPVHGTAR